MSSPVTTGAALAEARACLKKAGIETAFLDARVLGSAAFGMTAEELIRDEAHLVPADRLRCFRRYVSRRAGGEPVAYIMGRREFWSLDFAVAPGCLIPRPDSEAIVGAVLDFVGTRRDNLHLLDLGTGSGCLLLALLSEWKTAWGVGIDSDRRAIRTACQNAKRLGLAERAVFMAGDWAASVTGPFDVIIANPPYIPTADISGLARDVRNFEPHGALDGGADGLDAVRALLAPAAGALAPAGVLALEVGPGQVADVERLARLRSGLRKERAVVDLAGRERGILLRHP